MVVDDLAPVGGDLVNDSVGAHRCTNFNASRVWRSNSRMERRARCSCTPMDHTAARANMVRAARMRASGGAHAFTASVGEPSGLVP